MARVVHFDMSAQNPKGLVPFYERIFGWKFQKWDGPMEYWLITTGPDSEPGINGGLVVRQADSSTMNTLEVADIDKTLEQIKALGGKVLQDKGPIPGVGWYAQFADPEQNIFGLMQSDESAK
jgi:predicted enzyme related to lactoylglutathione lyase